MYRSILKELNNWKQEEQRKVLLIRGARQVGKTYIVREFGQSFEYFIEVKILVKLLQLDYSLSLFSVSCLTAPIFAELSNALIAISFTVDSAVFDLEVSSLIKVSSDLSEN